MSEQLENPIFISSLIGKGILLKILAAGSSAAENLSLECLSVENPKLLNLLKTWALPAAATRRRAARKETSCLKGIPDGWSCQHLMKFPLAVSESPEANKY